MTNTCDKLNEAKYFLERMKETQSNIYYAITERGRDAFRYDLSAFLSASRSITSLPKPRAKKDQWIMEKEFGHKSAFGAWYSTKDQQLQGDYTMVFLVEQRNITIHEEPTQPHGNTEVNFINVAPASSYGVLVSTPVDASDEERQALVDAAMKARMQSEPSPPPLPPNETINKQFWFFNELQKKGLPSDVVTVCEDHIAKLERLVDECERRFPLP